MRLLRNEVRSPRGPERQKSPHLMILTAFTCEPATPRMTLEVYLAMRDKMQNMLSCCFRKVATPLEAPDKSDYGDIDVLVAEPYEDCWLSEASLATQLKAHRWVRIFNSPTASYAISHPSQDAFIQVDVHMCSAENFGWQVFHQSHGDLWNLIGTSIRPKGLTANNEGLHMRIEEIENLDKRKSQVFLTREPKEVIELLCLDEIILRQPFASVDDLYMAVVKSRYFDPTTYTKATLKANDRKRLSQRKFFRDFVQTWIIDKSLTERSPCVSRGEVAREVLIASTRTSSMETSSSPIGKTWLKPG